MTAGKVLVTGAGGFIGRHVVALLRERGHDVRATDLPGIELERAVPPGVEALEGDLLDTSFCARAVDGVSGVVHLAAAFDLGLPAETLISTNVGTTRNLAGAAARSGVGMFVQYSTCDVFGLKRRGPTAEDDSKKPQCAYSRSKLLGELAAMAVMRKEGLPVAVVRPTFVYGPGAIYTARSFILLPALLARYTDSVPLPAGGPRTNTIHVEDMASATVAVLEAGPGAAGLSYNVADYSDMRASEFLRLVFAPFGISCKREVRLPWWTIEAAGRVGEIAPLRLFALLNGFLGRRWDRVIIQEELVPLLSPKLDRDFIGFLYGEHLYTNERIEALGWKPRYPTFADGWPGTVRWYRENSFIP